MKLVGTLKWDAELRFTPGGKALALAQVGDERVELWESLAEAFIDGPNGAMPMAGDVVLFEGYRKTRLYDGKRYPVFVAKRFMVIETGAREVSWSG